MKNNDDLWMNMAFQLAKESKCVSRHVGALLVKNGAIISSGVNGTPPGQDNCCDLFLTYNPETDRGGDHHQWSKDHELHAEVNLLGKAIQNGTNIHGSTLYVTLQPCSPCATLIASTGGISRIVYCDDYDKGTSDAMTQLMDIGIEVVKYEHDSGYD